MANVTIVSVLDPLYKPHIEMMGDHYAVLEGRMVVGVIVRSPGAGNEGMWALRWLYGSTRQSFDYVPLDYAMREAVRSGA